MLGMSQKAHPILDCSFTRERPQPFFGGGERTEGTWARQSGDLPACLRVQALQRVGMEPLRQKKETPLAEFLNTPLP